MDAWIELARGTADLCEMVELMDAEDQAREERAEAPGR